MRRALKTLFLLIILTTTTLSFAKTTNKPITIGILIPIDLPAMTQIVNGFKSELSTTYHGPIKYLVKNAQGDVNIQRSILEEFKSSNVDIVAPVGTAAAQMTIAMIHNKPIIGIAAENLKSEAASANNNNVTGNLDQVSVTKQIQFIHAAMPALKQLTVIYSTDDRIYKEVQELQKAAEPLDIHVQKLMITQLSDLYSVSKNISPKSQAIFILKDELIVSGINTLLQQAQAKHIPVIASDDGSVGKGAAFALGVSEEQIGISAAKVAIKILNGEKAGNIPVHLMTHYYVFLNRDAANSINVGDLTAAAKKLGYPVKNLG